MTSTQGSLSRRLGTGDAIVIGLGSMIGAGVFAVFGPAARAAGAGLLIGLALAAAVAYCNATASAQLAAVYPTSGGTYVYGRERLGDWWGFTAGWGFVIGKTASSAAMALTFATYVLPAPGWPQRLLAVVAVLGVAAVNYRGVTRTAVATRVLVTISLLCLAAFVIGVSAARSAGAGVPLASVWTGSVDLYGVLQSAGLLFFAFAGYARIATMGEEVREPRATIPRAILWALGIAVVVYALVGGAALLASGPAALAAAAAPLASAAQDVGIPALVPVVGLGATVASIGALMALTAGIGRTTLAMARNGDLPDWLAGIHPRFQTPHRAEVVLAVLVGVLVLAVDLRGAIGFSSFGVLVYYAIANAAAFTQPRADRRWPRTLNILGVVGCLVLVATLPWQSAVAGVAVLALGLLGRVVLRRVR